NQCAIRKQILGPVAELFDEAENIIPPTTVEPARMFAKLIQNLLRFERAENRLDQHGRAHGPARDAQGVLRENEDVVPQPRLEMALHFRQVEIRSAAACEELFGVMEKVESPVE